GGRRRPGGRRPPPSLARPPARGGGRTPASYPRVRRRIQQGRARRAAAKCAAARQPRTVVKGGLPMLPFGHHIAVEILGHEFAPETPLEHVMVFGATAVVLALTVYGAYAAVRDLRRRLREGKQRPAAPQG